MVRSVLSLVAFTLFAGAPLLAQAPAPAASHAAPRSAAKPALATKDGPSPLRIASMLFLVALLGGVAYYAKKKKQGKPLAQVSQQLRVLGSTGEVWDEASYLW